MTEDILKNAKKIHLIGVGGISMSSIAFILKKNGCEVSGSDMVSSEKTDELKRAGVKIFIGHSPDNITEDIDAVIYTADVHQNNCEYIKATQLGIPCLVRSVALGFLMKSYKVPIGVSGTHGKSTTTSMLSEIFTVGSKDPTVLSGADLSSNNGAYRLGTNEYFIFEACEYTESFLNFYPKIAVILNVEEDHLDYYKDIEHIKAAFGKFADLCGKDGAVIVNADDKNALSSVSNYKGKIITFGLSGNADFIAENIKFDHGRPMFDVLKNGKFYVSLKLSVFGEHNIMNSLAAVAASDLCMIKPEDAATALNAFKGAKRRFELLGQYNGADIVSDYAHHPTEIKTTLEAAMKIGYKKVTCIFQPHTFTRAKLFFDGFVSSLSVCDKAVLVPVYAKRDKDEYGVNSRMIAEKIKNAVSLSSLEDGAEYIKKNASSNELFILMGAGDINKIWKLLK